MFSFDTSGAAAAVFSVAVTDIPKLEKLSCQSRS